jgi:hypothetical protein
VPAGGAPGPVADLLDLPLASELVRPGPPAPGGRRAAWSQLPGAGLAAARLGIPELAGAVVVHDRLTVDGHEVTWWPATDDGAADVGAADDRADHVDGTPGALGRALAWRSGRWSMRQALAEAFAEPARADALAAEDSVGE